MVSDLLDPVVTEDINPEHLPQRLPLTFGQAQKTDGGNGNLTVGVTWGEALRTNTTSLPFGSTSICESIAP